MKEEKFEKLMKAHKPEFEVIDEHREVLTLKLNTKNGGHCEWCLWCDVIIDLNAKSITFFSDRGNWQAQWAYGRRDPDASFLKDLCQLSEGCLLQNMAKREEFDYEQSVERLREELEYGTNEFTPDNRKRIINEIINNADEYENDCDEWLRQIEDQCDEYSISTDDLYECIILDYPHYAKSVARIFRDDVQPYLRKMYQEMEDAAR